MNNQGSDDFGYKWEDLSLQREEQTQSFASNSKKGKNQLTIVLFFYTKPV